MPLVFYSLEYNSEVALWEATESDAFFQNSLEQQGYPSEALRQIKHVEKRLQWLASRYLLCKIYPEAIQQYMGRQPVLFNGPHISLSHSANNVAVVLSHNKAGIDIQVFSQKLERISMKFTNEHEVKLTGVENRVKSLSIIWSIKEAVFKKYETGLPFHDIRLIDCNLADGTAHVQLSYGGQNHHHTIVVKLLDKLSLAYLVD